MFRANGVIDDLTREAQESGRRIRGSGVWRRGGRSRRAAEMGDCRGFEEIKDFRPLFCAFFRSSRLLTMTLLIVPICMRGMYKCNGFAIALGVQNKQELHKCRP